jgi:hypothetical protein
MNLLQVRKPQNRLHLLHSIFKILILLYKKFEERGWPPALVWKPRFSRESKIAIVQCNKIAGLRRPTHFPYWL